MTINMRASDEDATKILQIVKRAADLRDCPGDPPTNRLQVAISLTVCHLNGCPLDLDKLLGTGDDTLAHDVFGIHDLISRETGKLPETFHPRCAKDQ